MIKFVFILKKPQLSYRIFFKLFFKNNFMVNYNYKLLNTLNETAYDNPESHE